MEPKSVNKIFYRRFNLIEQVKESEVFGIVIGSLSIKNLNPLLEDIKSTLKLNNKQYYQFLLGKITDEKLANFVEYIDCFILIACPFSEFYDRKALMKPLVSPLDVKIAFDPNYTWDMSYSFDINCIINKINHQTKISQLGENENNFKDDKGPNKTENFEKYFTNKMEALRLLE